MQTKIFSCLLYLSIFICFLQQSASQDSLKFEAESSLNDVKAGSSCNCEHQKVSRQNSCSSASNPPLHVNGVFPSLTATASSGPKRSESGTGALMPWADKLYMVSYLSVPDAGSGTGLYEINADFQVLTGFIL